MVEPVDLSGHMGTLRVEGVHFHVSGFHLEKLELDKPLINSPCSIIMDSRHQRLGG